MKKILSIVLVTALCLALFACGECTNHVDTDPKDAKCDVCGVAVACETCVDAEPKDAKCDVCGKAVACAICVDENSDGKCDVCSKDVEVLGASEIANILSMYNAIAPSRVDTESKAIFGEYEFSPITSTLLVGSVDGSSVAVYEYTSTSLREVIDGATVEIVGPFTTESHKLEYSAKLGLRTDGGKWNISGEDFTPVVGANAFNFTAETVTDMIENKDDKTYSFVVSEANTEAVFGEEIAADVTVVITHSGADITGVDISYTVLNDRNDDHPELSVTISCSYSYETQEITLD